MYCRRSYIIPGRETSEGVTHAYCAKCLFCMQYASEARELGLSLSEWLVANPDVVVDLKNAISEEIHSEKQGIVWEGEYNLILDKDIEYLFTSYEKRIKSELGSGETTAPDKR